MFIFIVNVHHQGRSHFPLSTLEADIKEQHRGAWVAQSVKHPTLDLSSRRDLEVRGIEPCLVSALIVQNLLGVHSLPFSLPLPNRVLSLSLSLDNIGAQGPSEPGPALWVVMDQWPAHSGPHCTRSGADTGSLRQKKTE